MRCACRASRPAASSGSSTRMVSSSRSTVGGPNWIGRDLSDSRQRHAPHRAPRRSAKSSLWPDSVERITGSATAHQVPWLVSVGLPTDIAFATGDSAPGWGALVQRWRRLDRLRHRLDAVRTYRAPAAAAAQGASVLRRRRPQPSHRSAGRATKSACWPKPSTGWRPARAAPGRSRRAADDLRQANDTLAAVIDASPVAIVCSDPERRIFMWSRAAEQMFGYTRRRGHWPARRPGTARTGRRIRPACSSAP